MGWEQNKKMPVKVQSLGEEEEKKKKK